MEQLITNKPNNHLYYCEFLVYLGLLNKTHLQDFRSKSENLTQKTLIFEVSNILVNYTPSDWFDISTNLFEFWNKICKRQENNQQTSKFGVENVLNKIANEICNEEKKENINFGNKLSVKENQEPLNSRIVNENNVDNNPGQCRIIDKFSGIDQSVSTNRTTITYDLSNSNCLSKKPNNPNDSQVLNIPLTSIKTANFAGCEGFPTFEDMINMPNHEYSTFASLLKNTDLSEERHLLKQAFERNELELYKAIIENLINSTQRLILAIVFRKLTLHVFPNKTFKESNKGLYRQNQLNIDIMSTGCGPSSTPFFSNNMISQEPIQERSERRYGASNGGDPLKEDDKRHNSVLSGKRLSILDIGLLMNGNENSKMSNKNAQTNRENSKKTSKINTTCHNRLYQDHFIKLGVNLLKNEQKKQQELTNCTFIPHINPSTTGLSDNNNNNPLLANTLNIPVYERLFKKKAFDPIKNWLMSSEYNDLKNATFQPDLKLTQKKHPRYNGSVDEKAKCDIGTRLFLYADMKAKLLAIKQIQKMQSELSNCPFTPQTISPSTQKLPKSKRFMSNISNSADRSSKLNGNSNNHSHSSIQKSKNPYHNNNNTNKENEPQIISFTKSEVHTPNTKLKDSLSLSSLLLPYTPATTINNSHNNNPHHDIDKLDLKWKNQFKKNMSFHYDTEEQSQTRRELKSMNLQSGASQIILTNRSYSKNKISDTTMIENSTKQVYDRLYEDMSIRKHKLHELKDRVNIEQGATFKPKIIKSHMNSKSNSLISELLDEKSLNKRSIKASDEHEKQNKSTKRTKNFNLLDNLMNNNNTNNHRQHHLQQQQQHHNPKNESNKSNGVNDLIDSSMKKSIHIKSRSKDHNFEQEKN